MTLAASIIIPNWNGLRHLPTCLDALRRQTRQDFEVIVVDNASTDGSQALMAEQYPEVLVLNMPRNVFFSGAVNAGIRIAKGGVLILLNNDTEAEPDWIAELLAALDEHPDAGMATSKLLLFDNRGVLHSAGDFYTSNGTPGNRGVWQHDQGQFDAEIWVFGACGAAAALRRSMLEDIGLFDEDFVGYCEDVDLSFRAQLAGYRCVFAPRARVYHRLSATGSGPTASYLCGRNFINVMVKNLPAETLRRRWPSILAAQARLSLRSLRNARQPAARAWLRGQLAALSDLPRMLPKRQKIQQNRRISVEALDGLLDA